jgi:hypothetical protein
VLRAEQGVWACSPHTHLRTPRHTSQVMNLYRIPMASFDPLIGTRYSEASGRPRPLMEAADGSAPPALPELVGSHVLFPSDLLPAELQEEVPAYDST